MKNVVGEQGPALPRLFTYKSHTLHVREISYFNDSGLKLAILIFLTCFFHFWH